MYVQLLNIVTIPSIFLINLLFQRCGIRKAMLSSVFIGTVGAWLRLFFNSSQPLSLLG